MKPDFKVVYNPQVYTDIQKIVDYYLRETGNDKVGKRFVQNMKLVAKQLSKNALHYQIRYADIRFLPVPDFSFMIHYRVDEAQQVVRVEAVFHTSQNPDEWK